MNFCLCAVFFKIAIFLIYIAVIECQMGDLFDVILFCSMQHVPGFIERAEEFTSKGVAEILCISGIRISFFY